MQSAVIPAQSWCPGYDVCEARSTLLSFLDYEMLRPIVSLSIVVVVL